MGRKTYYNRIQVPLYFVILMSLWAIVGIRLLVFRRRFPGWKTYRGVSMMFIIAAAVVCTVYVVLQITIRFLNMRTETYVNFVVMKKLGETSGLMSKDAAQLTDEQADQIIYYFGHIIHLLSAARFLLYAGLYVVKAAFLAIFLEVKGQLTRPYRALLTATVIVIPIAAIIGLWMILEDIIETAWKGGDTLTHEGVRSGIVTARWTVFNAEVEITHATLNIFTDIFLVIIAWKAIRSFPSVSLRAVLLPCSVVAITLALAIARLPIIIPAAVTEVFNANLAIPHQLFAECETFLGTVAACLPGLKVYIKSGDRANQRIRRSSLDFNPKEPVSRNGFSGYSGQQDFSDHTLPTPEELAEKHKRDEAVRQEDPELLLPEELEERARRQGIVSIERIGQL